VNVERFYPYICDAVSDDLGDIFEGADSPISME
jgi:hypothetical protein